MNKLKIYPGFSDVILAALKKKVEKLPQTSKLVSLVMDEMSIKQGLAYDASRDCVEGFTESKELANHALVFIIRGIVHQWKQPFGYFLSWGPVGGMRLKELLLEAITKLSQLGFQVCVVVADQGSNNQSLFQSHLKVTVNKPYFTIGDQKIFVMYDPPHLIKSVRNNLKNNGFEVSGKDVGWTCIQEFYDKDSSKQTRLAPKLRQKHLDLPPFSRLRVRLATQVLSHSVATGMKVMAEWGILSKDVIPTADFLENFDMLFNIFNSDSLYSPAKLRHAFSETSGHKDFLKKMLDWLPQLKYKGYLMLQF